MPSDSPAEVAQSSSSLAALMPAISGKNKSKKKLIVIVWMFEAMVVVLFLFSYFSIALLSSVRAYVEAEGHYSKGQKDAIYALARYAHYGQSEDYKNFLSNLAICQGDRQARESLEKASPDVPAAYQGFLQARNHPDDIDGMIRVFLQLRKVPEIDHAITVWEAADRHIENLSQIGLRVHKAVLAGTLSPAMTRNFLDELHDTNSLLTPLEVDFSATLGKVARKVKTLTVLALLVGVSLLLSGAYVFSRRIVRQNEEAEHLLLDSRNQLQHVLQLAPLSMFIVRVEDDAVVYANDQALAQFKVEESKLGEVHPQSLYVRQEDYAVFLAALKGPGSVKDLEQQFQDTQEKSFWARYSSLRIRFGEQDCVLTALIDIDDEKRAHDELHFRAFHDPLTGLPNRAMFMDSMEMALGRIDRKKGVFSIMFIDLDNFKPVNDALGHEMGDLLLQQVAGRIQSCIRRGDLAARLGGDEFVVLIEDLSDVREVSLIAHNILNMLERDYSLNGHTASITSSIGISSYPKNGSELNALLSAADTAMYRAKSAGRNNAQFYS